jgi:enolase
MMNIINGGAHADNPIDIQEFMIMPVGADTCATRCAWAPRSSTRSRRSCTRPGHNTNVGDEGGFAPNLAGVREALDFIMKSIEKAGYKPATTCGWRSIAPRPSSSRTAVYDLAGEGKKLDARPEMADYLAGLVDAYPIISIEDGMAEDDWDGWSR